MNTKHRMIVSALVMAALGLAASFVPREILLVPIDGPRPPVVIAGATVFWVLFTPPLGAVRQGN